MKEIRAICLKNLFIDGSFGSVILGTNLDRVRLLFKEATAEYEYSPNSLVLVYGNIEFFFRDRVLNSISWHPNLCTYNPYLPNAGSIDLDPWIVWNGLTMVEAERELIASSIEFRKVTIPEGLTYEGDSVVELITSCNTRLIFRGFLDWYLECFDLSRGIEIDTPLEKFLEFYTY